MSQSINFKIYQHNFLSRIIALLPVFPINFFASSQIIMITINHTNGWIVNSYALIWVILFCCRNRWIFCSVHLKLITFYNNAQQYQVTYRLLPTQYNEYAYRYWIIAKLVISSTFHFFFLYCILSLFCSITNQEYRRCGVTFNFDLHFTFILFFLKHQIILTISSFFLFLQLYWGSRNSPTNRSRIWKIVSCHRWWFCVCCIWMPSSMNTQLQNTPKHHSIILFGFRYNAITFRMYATQTLNPNLTYAHIKLAELMKKIALCNSPTKKKFAWFCSFIWAYDLIVCVCFLLSTMFSLISVVFPFHAAPPASLQMSVLNPTHSCHDICYD